MKVVENRKGGSMLPGRVRTEGKKFIVNGKEIWMNGVNTPWKDVLTKNIGVSIIKN